MWLEIVQPFLDLLSDHPYAFMFVGLMFAGELILLPAIYMAVTGRLQIEYVFAVGVAATALSDVVWYYLGRRLPPSRFERFAGRRTARVMQKLERLYARRGPQILVMSKFVYGSRTAAQLLAGAHAMRLRTYLVANTTGVVLLVGVLIGLAYSVSGTVNRFGELVEHIEVAFLLFVLLAIGLHVAIARWVRSRWSR